MAEEQITIQLPNHEIKLERATIEKCSELFETQDESNGKKTYKLKHDNKRILDLAPLNSLRIENECLLPPKVFVRDCMQELFHYLVTTPDDMFNTVLGSPGVGKSLLSFLAALQIALINEHKTVLFMRKTSNHHEHISVFLIRKSKTEGSVDVNFQRRLYKVKYTLRELYIPIMEKVEKEVGETWDIFKHLRTFIDGPNYKHEEDIPPPSDLVTSGGCPIPKQEAEQNTRMMPLNAWSIQEMRDGMKALHQVRENIVDIIYDTVGGSYRTTSAVTADIFKYKTCGQNQATQIDNFWSNIDVNDEVVESQIKFQRKKFDSTIKKATKANQNIHAYIATTEVPFDANHVDRLRSMYAKFHVYGEKLSPIVIQFLVSAYVARQLRSMISLESLREALNYAKTVHSGACYGWHFEYFGHMVFRKLSENLEKNENSQNPDPIKQTVDKFDVAEGEVSKLDRDKLYWTPDIPNFRNIDAAIALDNILYCLQYTISSDQHKFNYSTFVSTFWEKLQNNFKSQIKTIKVVFVLPSLPQKQDSNENDPYKVVVENETDKKYLRVEKGIVIHVKKSKATAASLSPAENGVATGGDESESNPPKKKKLDAIHRIELTKEFLSETYKLTSPPLPFMRSKTAEEST